MMLLKLNHFSVVIPQGQGLVETQFSSGKDIT